MIGPKQLDIPLISLASDFTIPPSVSGQDQSVRIGGCIYGKYEGIYAYKVYGELTAVGLKHDGTWGKFGDPFPAVQAAYGDLACYHTHQIAPVSRIFP